MLCRCGGIGSFEHERCLWQIQRVREGAAVEIYDFGHRKPFRGARLAIKLSLKK